MDKIWLHEYQPGVLHEVSLDSYSSLIALFDEAFTNFKNNIAYVNMGHELSYAELELKSRVLAAYLQSLKLKKGSRVAIMMPNLLQYPIALFAILRAGLIAVNTNPLYTANELTYQLNDCEAEAIVVMANFANTLQKALPSIPSLKHVIITEIGDEFSPLKRTIVNAVVKYIKHLVPKYCIPQAVSWHQALSVGQNCTYSKIDLNHDDIAFIQYTGGTTGVSKGAMLTHGNMVANLLQAGAWLAPLKVGADDIIITALPLYHIFSLTANCLTFLRLGAKNILITNPKDSVRFINEIKNTKFTAITGVNTLFNSLLNHPNFVKVDFSKLKLALSGGMSLQKSVSLRWTEVTKTPILEAYGLTETSPAVTINPLSQKKFNGSIGLPLPSTEISIRDEFGLEVALGEKGELCVRGPQVMRGYWNQPKETANVFWPDHFLRTGDIARMDEKGYIYLMDRIKDMILVSGFNVYPNEVEQVIGHIPGVLEVGVISAKNSEGIELVKACIVKRDQNLTEQDVIAHCRKHLTAYKIPKIIEFYKELPKTNVGKVLRRALR